MKKILLLSLVSISIFMPQLYSISVAEYIQQNGIPQIQNNELNLSSKNLTDLTGLQNIPNINQVIILGLSYNQLKTLPDTIFNGLKNLQILSIDNNQLQTLPDTIFNGLQNLQKLLLYGNQLQTLPANIFNGLKNLQILSISNNQLQTLPDGIFNGLNNLKYLGLSYNQLQSLPVTIFNGLNSLKDLHLARNPFRGDFLANLPDVLKSMPRLKYLDYRKIDKALQAYRIYQPKTLQEITKKYAMQNLTPEQIEELAVAGDPAFDLLPLTSQQRAAIIAKNIGAFKNQKRLHELSNEILDLLPLTPQERAGIAAQKR